MTWLITTLLLLTPPGSLDSPADGVHRLLARAFPDGAPVDGTNAGSREAFQAVLASDLFSHREVGLFDLYVMRADGLAGPSGKPKSAKKRSKRKPTDGFAGMDADALAEVAAAGLAPAAELIDRLLPGEGGLVAGRRLPVVLAVSDRSAGETGFDELVALLDWAEDDYSGWKQGGNPIFTDALLDGLNVRTWEVQVFNLAHEHAAAHGDAFLEHGLGYYNLAHVVARLLRQGSWGLVPPWLAQGLIDELDIAAHGEAWVGHDQFLVQRPGWFREGWSGFVPQGQLPPPPVTGPPADLAVTITRVGDSWQHRDFSVERHWEHLAADRDSEAPVSFAFMAANESFLPRDRAAARWLLHVLLEIAPNQGPTLLERFDVRSETPPSGMPATEPITAVISAALNGVPAVDALESLPLGDLLDVLERPDMAARLTELGAAELLEIADHRDQAAWLYAQTVDQLDAAARMQIWTLILEAEYHQQLLAWRHLGEAVDDALDSTLRAVGRYPAKDRERSAAAEAFWSAL